MLVVGLARTGVTGAFCSGPWRHRHSHGRKARERTRRYGGEASQGGREARTRRPYASAFLEQDLVVLSPGVPANLPAVELARAPGIPVWSEIELAWRFFAGRSLRLRARMEKPPRLLLWLTF